MKKTFFILSALVAASFSGEAATSVIVDFGSTSGPISGGNTFSTPPAGGGSSGTYTGNDARITDLVNTGGQSTGWTLTTTGLRWDNSMSAKNQAEDAWNTGTAMSDLTQSLGADSGFGHSCWGDNVLIASSGVSTLTLSGLTVGQSYTISLGVGRGDNSFGGGSSTSQKNSSKFTIDLTNVTSSSSRYSMNNDGLWTSLSAENDRYGNNLSHLQFGRDAAEAGIMQLEVTPDENGTISFDLYSNTKTGASYQAIDFMTITTVPEPAGSVLLASGVLLLSFRRKTNRD